MSESNLLTDHDAVGLAELIRSGQISAAEATEASLTAIERHNPALNVVLHRLDDRARAAVETGLPAGPFHGVPLVIKDLYAPTAGDPMHNGMAIMKMLGHVSTHESDLIGLYRAAGFSLTGRTNTPELGLVATTEPLSHGPARNPWNPDFGTGGSSGGSAGAVAAGMASVGHASDGGGSIRIPAALCGLVGLKPSRGRIPMGPDGEEWGLSIQHAVTRTLRDSAAVLDVSAVNQPGDGVFAPHAVPSWAAMIGRDPGPLRVALLATSYRDDMDVDPEVEAATRTAAAHLEALGHDVVEECPPCLRDPELGKMFLAMWTSRATRTLQALSDMLGHQITEADVEPSTWIQAEIGRKFSAADLLASMESMARMRRQMADWWQENCDVMVTPTCALPAPRIGDLTSTEDDPMRNSTRSAPYATFTSPFNVTGQPGISLPLGMTSSGLPIGVQLVGAYGREDVLFQVGGQLEEHFIPLAPPL